ncbi:MAG TPA: nucleotidyltransferase family protein [Acidimicrobiales bacterium]|nr:nucleotidyltransferase family protein [Acidimicrobiales bacterium]
MTTAAVVLAAGAGTRFSGDRRKLLAKVGGKSLVSAALRPAVGAGFDEVVVVTGALDLVDALPEEVTILHNEIWERGQATSLRVALDWCARQGHDTVVVGLGDQPWLTEDAWRRVAAETTTPIAVATYAGKRGHPVRLAATAWPLLPVDGDEGARSVMRGRPELVTEVPCEGDPRDIDTMEELRRWS